MQGEKKEGVGRIKKGSWVKRHVDVRFARPSRSVQGFCRSERGGRACELGKCLETLSPEAAPRPTSGPSGVLVSSGHVGNLKDRDRLSATVLVKLIYAVVQMRPGDKDIKQANMRNGRKQDTVPSHIQVSVASRPI